MLVEPGFFRTELLTPESTNYAEPSIDDSLGHGEREVPHGSKSARTL
jgi:hypothetical protein